MVAAGVFLGLCTAAGCKQSPDASRQPSTPPSSQQPSSPAQPQTASPQSPASTAQQPAGNSQARPQPQSPAAPADSLSAKSKVALERMIAAGSLRDLDDPGFSRDRTEVKKFYLSLGGRLAWISGSQPTQPARQMVQTLQNARSKGLDPENYDGPHWQDRLDEFASGAKPSDDDILRFDLALTVSSMRYLSDLYAGRMNPTAFGFELDVKHRKLGLAQFLKEQIIGASDVAAAIASIEPQIPAYQRTEQALGRYLNLAGQKTGADRLPPLPRTVKPGGVYRGVPKLAQRLATLGDISPDEAQKISGTKYDGEIVDAVKRFQRENGIDANGELGPETLRALNASPEARIFQIEATLEHWRWLPRTDARVIIVNIPAYSLEALDDQLHPELSMEVVVGDAYDHKTPELASEIKTVIFRPYWDVPLNIQKKELVPKIARSPKYLDANDFEIVSSAGKPVERKEGSHLELARLREGAWKLRQKPGPDNAVGLVKFEFPNSEDIYLHGTPETKLFDRKSRDLSHGCIRIADPEALAAWVLKGLQDWSSDRINSAMNGDKTERASVAPPVPVWIVYATAVANEDGSVNFHKDVYGYDEKFRLAIRHESPAKRPARRAPAKKSPRKRSGAQS